MNGVRLQKHAQKDGLGHCTIPAIRSMWFAIRRCASAAGWPSTFLLSSSIISANGVAAPNTRASCILKANIPRQ